MARTDNASPVIMVVDDSADNREVLRVIFERGGYKVVEAANGQKAVEIAERECPDLIFMDLSMPTLDGYGAVPLIREVKEMRSVPIIACTAHDTSDHRARAFAVGFNEYLTKPVDFIQLASLVDRFLMAA
jgi:two-component system, cell cycle response regulator DivK